MTKLLLLPVCLVMLSFGLACGDSDEPKATPVPTTPSVQELSIKTGDWFYDPNEFKVRPGTVRVTMTNVGPQAASGHTFNVKNKSGDGDLFKSDDRVVVGESKTYEFTVTEEGSYQLLCTVRGHADRGHVGTLVVGRQ